MLYIRLLLLLQLLVSPLYIRGDDEGRTEDDQKKDEVIGKLISMVQAQTDLVEALNENVKFLRKSLDKRLRENDLKIEWALTDGTLAPKNTSGIMENLARQEEKIDESLAVLKEVQAYTTLPGTCADIDGGGAHGVHKIFPNGGKAVLAFCEETVGGGWTVIQKRTDGSVDFFRGWEDYVTGFGDPADEYWLGLHTIHTLTKTQPMELYVGLTDFDLGLRFARYSSFSVSSSEDKFRIRIGTYSGNAGDSLRYHDGQQFSTNDQDNDPSKAKHCSQGFHGAWWYNGCMHSNLNGRFTKVKVFNGNARYMSWFGLHGSWTSLKGSVMMIRPSNFIP